MWVCGKAKVNFELLRRHTRYPPNLSDDSILVKNFWEILNELKDTDKLK